jgi:CDP-diacylglycerol--glycerol-3-phosphate 3-phosphatidyltransferase
LAEERLVEKVLKQLPNALTVSRFGAALAFAFCDPKLQIPIFLYACASEFLDGFLARLLKAETRLGKILDPIADKTFILTVIVTLMVENKLHFYQLLMIGYRDLTVIGGALVVLAARNWANFREMDPGLIGKLTTAVQFLFLFSVLYLDSVHATFLWTTAAVSFIAAVFYVKFFFDRGLHVENGVGLDGAAARKRRAEMLALVAMTMFLGVLLIGSGFTQARQNALIDELRSTCGSVCEGLGW